jgi:DNA polymerase-1
MKQAVFVLGHVTPRAASAGQAISDADLVTIEELAARAGVEVALVLACEDRATHGYEPSMKQIRAERPRLLAEIEAAGADLVVAFGRHPVRALWDKGSLKTSDLQHKDHKLDGITAPVIVVPSLEELAVKSGLIKWLGLDILRSLGEATEPKLGEYVVQTEIHPDLAAYLADRSSERRITVDLETFPGVNPYAPDARIRMVVISHRTGWAQVVQCGPASEVPDWVRDILSDPSVLKGGSNIRFDVRWLRRFGIEVVNYVCTQHIEHILDENTGIKDLKTLSLRYHPDLGDYSEPHRRLVEERSIRDPKGKLVESGWRFISDAEMYPYAGGDGDAGITILKAQLARTQAEGMARPLAVLREVYPAISELEMAGACVDLGENRALRERYQEDLRRLSMEIRGALGANINPRSPNQLIPALQELVPYINLKDFFKKKKDEDDEQYSTKAFVLNREARKHPIIGTILEFRRLEALYRFINKLPTYAVEIRGRHYIFSSLRGDITATYRHSSSKPNLQNLPRNREENDYRQLAPALNPKRQYVSRFEGGTIAEWDQSQLELRETGMVAHVSALETAFAAGEDVHTTLAAMMAGIEPAEVTKEIRQDFKTTNFRVLYGGGAYGLSLVLGCSEWKAQSLIDKFDETMWEYREWEAARHVEAIKRGWVESRYGFRRRFPVIPHGDRKALARIRRQAGNTPIQGGASMHTNLWIAAVVARIKREGLRSVPFLTVHDSLVVDVYPGELERVDEICRQEVANLDTMKYGVDLTIPLKVDGKVGPDWASMEDIK